jgi:hypothetical protein
MGFVNRPMDSRFVFASLTRIAELERRSFAVEARPRAEWRNGDYVVAEVINHSTIPVELTTGRMAEVYRGDWLVGALGRRCATLEAVGSWEDVGDDGHMHALTGAGLLGKLSSASVLLPPLVRLQYRGHVYVDGAAVSMGTYAGSSATTLAAPVVLIVGTSMSAGKTATARVLARRLRARGLRVVGAKLTGAGRYRDILTMRDAGAHEVFDFVDAGLPSSICAPAEYRARLRGLLGLIADAQPDVVIAEAGASPLESYNGGTAIAELGDRVKCLILAAADPYSVVGIEKAFGMKPDVVTGLATSTEAACDLVERLAGVPAINVLDRRAQPRLEEIVAARLGIADD